MEAVDQLKVFLSFADFDGRPHAERLKEWLERTLSARVYVFYERPLGEHFPTTLARAADECDVMLFLMTPASVRSDSEWCAREVAYARDAGARVIPVKMVAGVKAPLYIKGHNHVDLSIVDGPGWETLARDLRTRGSATELKRALERDRDLWAGRQPAAGEVRRAFDEVIGAPLAEDIRQQQIRLDAPTVSLDLTGALAAERELPTVIPAPGEPGIRVISAPPECAPAEFTDRTTERERLRAYLTDPTVRLVTLVGVTGAGKTTMLSRLVGALCEEQTPGIEWLAYLPAFGQPAISTDTILGTLAQIADAGEIGGPYQDMLQSAGWTWHQTLDRIVAGVGQQRIVLILDNVERLLDPDGGFASTDLSRMVNALAEQPDHRIALVLSSDKPLDLPHATQPVTRSVPVDGGLTRRYAIEFLRSMDPHGLLRIRSARHADLEWLCEQTDGHPRALEAVASILLSDPDATVATISIGIEFDRPAGTDATTYLVQRVIDAVNPHDVQVLVALAIFGQPVPAVAIDYLLEPHLGGYASRATLIRLLARRIIRADGERFYLPSGLDIGLVLDRVEPGDPDQDDPDSADWTRIDLALHAAEYFIEVAKSLPSRVEDLAPQFSEVEQRMRAADNGGAVAAIHRMTELWLEGWGQHSLTIPWLMELRRRHLAPNLAAAVLIMLAKAQMHVGEYLEAKEVADEAIRLLPDVNTDQAAEILLAAGTATYADGQVTAAAEHYSRIVSTTGVDGDVSIRAHSGLLLCRTEVGRFDEAFEHLTVARERLDAIPPVDAASLKAQLHLNEAWLHGFRGATEDMRESITRARQMSRNVDEKVFASTYSTEAMLHIDEGHYRDAVRCADRAIDIAAGRHDVRLLQQAKAHTALGYLCLGELMEARTAAEFATAISQRHGALLAFALKGHIAFRRGDDAVAATAFYRAHLLASRYVQLERHNFEVWDLLGFVTCAIGLDDPRPHEAAMVDAFRRAREITPAAGAVRRISLLLDQLAIGTRSSLVSTARSAAAGIAFA